jgi:hypothetical protein
MGLRLRNQGEGKEEPGVILIQTGINEVLRRCSIKREQGSILNAFIGAVSEHMIFPYEVHP